MQQSSYEDQQDSSDSSIIETTMNNNDPYVTSQHPYQDANRGSAQQISMQQIRYNDKSPTRQSDTKVVKSQNAKTKASNIDKWRTAEGGQEQKASQMINSSDGRPKMKNEQQVQSKPQQLHASSNRSQKQTLQYQRIQRMHHAVEQLPSTKHRNQNKKITTKTTLTLETNGNQHHSSKPPAVIVDSKCITYANATPQNNKNYSSENEQQLRQNIHQNHNPQHQVVKGQIMKRNQHLLGAGHSSLSISSIESNQQNSGTQKPHMDSISKQRGSTEQSSYNQVVNALQQQQQQSIDINDQDECEIIDNDDDLIITQRGPTSPKVNKIRGLTPQNRLMSSQKMEQDSTLTENMRSAIQATTVGSKDQFNKDISLTRKVEPKRSVSVSAKKTADELQRPYNRRAQILKERKEALKLQARENSFQRSQKKTDNSMMYSRPTDGAKGGVFAGDSASMSNHMFNTSIFVSNPQQTQIYTGGPGRSGQIGGSMLNYDPLNHSSFDLNEQFMSQSIPGGLQHRNTNHVVKIKHASQHMNIQPGNQQNSTNNRPQVTEDSSGIERAKQIINEKFQKMVDWGQFTSPFQRQQANNSAVSYPQQPQSTVRTVGNNTQREINKAGQNYNNRNKTRIEVDDLGNQPTFGVQPQYPLGVFTPPAAASSTKNFKLTIDDQGRVVPFTERESEGEIPQPNRSPGRHYPNRQPHASQSQLLSRQQRSMYVQSQKNTPKMHGSGEMTLNPNNQHGVAVGVTKLQQHLQGISDVASQLNMSAVGKHYQQPSGGQNNRIGKGGAAAVSEKSTKSKSLKDILSGARRSSRHSQSSINRGHGAMIYNPQMVNSPQMEASVHIPHQPFGVNTTQQSMVSDRRNQEVQYPCSAFFQNDENFEKQILTEQSQIIETQHIDDQTAQSNSFMLINNNVRQQHQNGNDSTYSPMLNKHNHRRLQQSGTIDGDGLESAIQLISKDDSQQSLNQQSIDMQFGVLSAIKSNLNDVDSTVDGHQFITSFHPPANIQGESEEALMPVSRLNQLQSNFAKSQCQSPTSLLKCNDLSEARRQQQIRHKRLQQSASANNMNVIINGGNTSQQLSLTARKNLTHQKKRSPQNTAQQMSGGGVPGIIGTHYKNISPRFNVVDKQRETSAGRLSIVSMNLNAIQDDLPPDPMFQTNTLSPRPDTTGNPSSNFKGKLLMNSRFTSQQNNSNNGQQKNSVKTPTLFSKMQHKSRVSTNFNQGYITSQGNNDREARHEIIAVAPKINQLSLVEQQTTSQMSVLITTSDHTNDLASRYSNYNMIESCTSNSNKRAMILPDDQLAQHSRQAYHKAQPSLATLQNEVTPRVEEDESNPNPKVADSIIKVQSGDPDNDSDDGRTESEKKRRKRENSFIRNGYEVYFEGTYIINGRRKKKIKKRKLSKFQLERHNKVLDDKIRKEKKAAAAGYSTVFKIEKELEAINSIRKQTQEMSENKFHPTNKVVTLKQSQVQLKTGNMPSKPQSNQLNAIRLQKQRISQINLASGVDDENSPRIIIPQNTQVVTKVKIVNNKNNTISSLNEKQNQQVQIPRKLFVKNLNPTPYQNMVQGIQEESKKAVINQVKLFPTDQNQTSSTRSLNFRDPDLQLITSSRQLTLRDVSVQWFQSCTKFIIHRMIFQKKFPELLKVFRSGFLTVEHLNEKDHLGNTPLLLAAKLSANEEEYLKCINFLFKQGCDGKIRDSNGWSILDEAIVQVNSRLLGISFNWLNIRKKEKITRNKIRVLSRLKQIPDFYCELHWECQSSWIPFLSKIAPSDDFQIWKVGSNIRLDFSLVGFKKLQNKRRRMTILFRNASEDESDERYNDIDIIMVNKDREILSNPLEDLDEDEKLAVLTDIMNADPVQNELNIKRQDWDPVSNFFGSGQAKETVNGYECSKFKLQIQAQVRSKKKVTQRFQHNYDSYFEGAEEYNEENKVVQDPESFKMAKDVEKTVESQLWLSQEYPLQFEQFMEVLDTLAISGQASMQKIHEFLQNDCLKDVVSRNGFPVKIQVPIGMIVKAMVTFGNFEFLHPENREEYIKETFAIPDYCKLVSRKEAMKTMQSKKKRLAVANVVI